MYFVDSRSITGRRGSFDGGYELGSFTDFDYMGNNFLFVNREAECKQLVTRFGEMDLHVETEISISSSGISLRHFASDCLVSGKPDLHG